MVLTIRPAISNGDFFVSASNADTLFILTPSNNLLIGISSNVSPLVSLTGTMLSVSNLIASRLGVGQATVSNYAFSVNGDSLLINARIQGSLGVGGTNPDYALSVYGAALFSSNVTSSCNVQIVGNLGVGSGISNASYALNVTGNASMSSNAQILGKIGIGGAWNSNYALTVAGSSLLSNAQVLGYVGIGSSVANSNYALTVAGSANFSSNISTGCNAQVLGYVGIGSAWNSNYALSVAGHTNVSSNAQVLGKMGIGGAWNSNYSLSVIGNVNFTGALYQGGTLFTGSSGSGSSSSNVFTSWFLSNNMIVSGMTNLSIQYAAIGATATSLTLSNASVVTVKSIDGNVYAGNDGITHYVNATGAYMLALRSAPTNISSNDANVVVSINSWQWAAGSFMQRPTKLAMLGDVVQVVFASQGYFKFAYDPSVNNANGNLYSMSFLQPQVSVCRYASLP